MFNNTFKYKFSNGLILGNSFGRVSKNNNSEFQSKLTVSKTECKKIRIWML
jgi:hypothetical protein